MANAETALSKNETHTHHGGAARGKLRHVRAQVQVRGCWLRSAFGRHDCERCGGVASGIRHRLRPARGVAWRGGRCAAAPRTGIATGLLGPEHAGAR